MAAEFYVMRQPKISRKRNSAMPTPATASRAAAAKYKTSAGNSRKSAKNSSSRNSAGNKFVWSNLSRKKSVFVTKSLAQGSN